MKVSDLFNLYQGNSFELINMEHSINSNVNFISRSSNNNGVSSKVDEIAGIKPYPAGMITVALSGSVLSTFVQQKPFYTGFHIMVLEPKKEMSFNEKLFYAMCINRNSYKYNYDRQANKTLKNIIIPDKVPENISNNKIDINILCTMNNSPITLNVDNWKKIKLIDYFDMYAGKYFSSDNFDIGDIPLVSASDTDNGIMKYTNLSPIFKQNCLTIGKVGITTYYQNIDFCASSDVTVLVPKMNFNKYIGLFITTIINKEKFKWSYGRQVRLGDCQKLEIFLPTDEYGEPDWLYMENYIRSMPYADKI